MATKNLITVQAVAGWLLIISALIFFVGGMLYTGRAIWKWPIAGRPAYLGLERGFVIAALLVNLLGMTLLERLLEPAGDAILAPLGLMIYLTGVVLVIGAEAYFISKQELIYAPTVVFVVLAFVGQAIFGISLLRTGLLPAWIGWATVVWNLAWLVILPIARPRDMYYPWLHYAAPLLIGIALLLKG